MNNEWDFERAIRWKREDAERNYQRNRREEAEGAKWVDYENRMKWWVKHGGQMPTRPDEY